MDVMDALHFESVIVPHELKNMIYLRKLQNIVEDHTHLIMVFQGYFHSKNNISLK